MVRADGSDDIQFATADEVDGIRRTLDEFMKTQEAHNQAVQKNFDQLMGYLHKLAAQPSLPSAEDKGSNFKGNPLPIPILALPSTISWHRSLSTLVLVLLPYITSITLHKGLPRSMLALDQGDTSRMAQFHHIVLPIGPFKPISMILMTRLMSAQNGKNTLGIYLILRHFLILTTNSVQRRTGTHRRMKKTLWQPNPLITDTPSSINTIMP